MRVSLRVPGLIKGLGVTFKTLIRTLTKGSHTIQYPRVKEAPTLRARGVIALHEENCTACMLCARECPDWCIYIEGHKYKAPPRRPGGKPRQKNALDRFDIDFALCMYYFYIQTNPIQSSFLRWAYNNNLISRNQYHSFKDILYKYDI